MKADGLIFILVAGKGIPKPIWQSLYLHPFCWIFKCANLSEKMLGNWSKPLIPAKSRGLHF